MNDYLQRVLRKYKNKGIFIDTNIALLYVVGSFNISFVRKNKRTATYSEKDFQIVSALVDSFAAKVTTPNVLTEVSDMLPNMAELTSAFAAFVKISSEYFSSSTELIKMSAFNQFGLADSSVFATAKDKYLVFTDDRPLFGYLMNNGIDAVNMDIIREI